MKKINPDYKKGTIQISCIYIMIYILASTIIQILCNWDTKIYIASSLILIFICIYYAKLNIVHPYVWYVPVFIIYQISYPWLKEMGINTSVIENLNDNYIIINWIASISTVIFLSNIKPVKYKMENIEGKINKSMLTILYIIIICISIMGSIYIVKEGFSSKYNIAQSSNIIISITQIAFNMISIITLFILLNKEISNKQKIFFFLLSFVIMALGMGVLGERDLIIKYVIIMLMYYVIIKKPSIIKILTLVCAVVILISISSSLKMFLVRENEQKNEQNLLVKFLTSDFQAAGFNFNYILNHKEQWDYKQGSTLLYDFLSPLRRVIQFEDSQISIKWYQQTFWANRITGMGFSIIAEGYINFSTPGVILWCFIICMIIRKLYTISNKSIYKFVQYICLCPICMYIARADLANLISPFIKYIVLVNIIIYFISERKKNSG